VPDSSPNQQAASSTNTEDKDSHRGGKQSSSSGLSLFSRIRGSAAGKPTLASNKSYEATADVVKKNNDYESQKQQADCADTDKNQVENMQASSGFSLFSRIRAAASGDSSLSLKKNESIETDTEENNPEVKTNEMFEHPNNEVSTQESTVLQLHGGGEGDISLQMGAENIENNEFSSSLSGDNEKTNGFDTLEAGDRITTLSAANTVTIDKLDDTSKTTKQPTVTIENTNPSASTNSPQESQAIGQLNEISFGESISDSHSNTNPSTLTSSASNKISSDGANLSKNVKRSASQSLSDVRNSTTPTLNSEQKNEIAHSFDQLEPLSTQLHTPHLLFSNNEGGTSSEINDNSGTINQSSGSSDDQVTILSTVGLNYQERMQESKVANMPEGESHPTFTKKHQGAFPKAEPPSKENTTKEEINNIRSAKDNIRMKHDDIVDDSTIATNASVASMIIHSYDIEHGSSVLGGDTSHVSDSQLPQKVNGSNFLPPPKSDHELAHSNEDKAASPAVDPVITHPVMDQNEEHLLPASGIYTDKRPSTSPFVAKDDGISKSNPNKQHYLPRCIVTNTVNPGELPPPPPPPAASLGGNASHKDKNDSTLQINKKKTPGVNTKSLLSSIIKKSEGQPKTTKPSLQPGSRAAVTPEPPNSQRHESKRHVTNQSNLSPLTMHPSLQNQLYQRNQHSSHMSTHSLHQDPPQNGRLDQLSQNPRHSKQIIKTLSPAGGVTAKSTQNNNQEYHRLCHHQQPTKGGLQRQPPYENQHQNYINQEQKDNTTTAITTKLHQQNINQKRGSDHPLYPGPKHPRISKLDAPYKSETNASPNYASSLNIKRGAIKPSTSVPFDSKRDQGYISVAKVTPSKSPSNSSKTACINANFDELLTIFLNDLRDGTDLRNKSDAELLELDVELSQAYSVALRYRGEMVDLLEEIDIIQSMANKTDQVAEEP